MTTTNGLRHLTSQFTYNPQTRRFSAEMSDLGRAGTAIAQVDDNGVVGFDMVGKTRTVRFVLTDQVFDEGDLLHVDFQSTDGDFTATLFND